MHLEHRYDQLWGRLLVLLDTLGELDVSTPGRLRLTVERHELVLVMTEREWDDLVSIPHGSFVGAAGHLLHAIGRAQMDRSPYLVYDQYELHPCPTPEKPVQAQLEADRMRVEEHLRQNPGATFELRAFRPGQEPS